MNPGSTRSSTRPSTRSRRRLRACSSPSTRRCSPARRGAGDLPSSKFGNIAGCIVRREGAPQRQGAAPPRGNGVADSLPSTRCEGSRTTPPRCAKASNAASALAPGTTSGSRTPSRPTTCRKSRAPDPARQAASARVRGSDAACRWREGDRVVGARCGWTCCSGTSTRSRASGRWSARARGAAPAVRGQRRRDRSARPAPAGRAGCRGHGRRRRARAVGPAGVRAAGRRTARARAARGLYPGSGTTKTSDVLFDGAGEPAG